MSKYSETDIAQARIDMMELQPHQTQLRKDIIELESAENPNCWLIARALKGQMHENRTGRDGLRHLNKVLEGQHINR